MRRALVSSLQFALFGGALFGAAVAAEGFIESVSQALIWLPTGVAIVGVWLLGLRAAFVIATTTLLHRLYLGYPASVWLPAMTGSAFEAMLAVLLLRRWRISGTFAQLREVWLLIVIAMLAPLASITGSWIARSMPGLFRDTPFHSGWDGWWRMNLLGVLTVVPFALLWLDRTRPISRRELVANAGVGLSTVALVAAVMLGMTPGSTPLLLLTMVLPIALLAAVHIGPRGAATAGTLGALAISIFAAHGIGAFESLPYAERHSAAQIYLVALVSVPLVFGALIAERGAEAARSLQREGLHQALVEVLPDAIYRLRADDTIADLHAPRTFPMVAPAAQLIGRRLADLFTPAVAERLLEQVENARRGSPVTPIEYPLTTAVGDREVRYVPLSDGEVLGVVRDVSARKAAERQLGWQADVLEAIAASHPTTSVLAAIVAGIERFLPGCRASLFLVQGKRLHLTCAPSLPAEYNASVDGLAVAVGNGCCGNAAATGCTTVASDLDTDPLWRDFRDLASRYGLRACWSVPVRSAAGVVLGTFAVYHDTPRTPSPAEIALVERVALLTSLAIERQRREELLASIQENVSEGLFRRVPDQGLLYANTACARLFGYDSAAALLAAAAAARTANDGDLHRQSLAWLANTLVATHHEERELHRRDGQPFLALVSTTLVRGPDGTLTACDGALADITANRQMTEQLRQSQKMEAVGHLAGGIAHDFNNLLTAIGGYAEIVRNGLPPGDPLYDDAGEILRAAQRAADLTRQLLAFGRRQVLTPHVLDLRSAVDQMLVMLRRLIGERVEIRTLHAADPVHAQVDRGQLEQVLLNLVLNARDAMPDGGIVTIRTGISARTGAQHGKELTPGEYAEIAVTDTGIGMSAEVRARAFDPFFTTKPVGKGSGLGLSTVYGIVKQSGGSVAIDSAPGRGTTILVHLPLTAATPTAEPAQATPQPRGKAAKLLVVEDEPLVRDLLQRTLLRAGHTVVTAQNGEQALLQAQSHADFDAVITDVVMPHMGGRELITRLRRTNPTLPVLFVSGYSDDSESLLRATAGHGAVLTKPFTSAQLQEALARLLPDTATTSKAG